MKLLLMLLKTNNKKKMFSFGFPFVFPALGGLLFGYDIGATFGAIISLQSPELSGTAWLCGIHKSAGAWPGGCPDMLEAATSALPMVPFNKLCTGRQLHIQKPMITYMDKAESGGFVLWQMMPDMWYVELAVEAARFMLDAMASLDAGGAGKGGEFHSLRESTLMERDSPLTSPTGSETGAVSTPPSGAGQR
ncbi:hypothetical protein Scep_028288 [Stephania cephalantha]|uniref:Uncharacterized protein n=1 Tax=Stephania cephalantha TaxID=152367 RepID=A0AAP0HLY0_9MAGN